MAETFPCVQDYCKKLEHELMCYKNLADQRIAVIAYRDYGDGALQLEVLPFGGRSAAGAFVRGLKATNVGNIDFPEDVLGGLQAALALPWRDGRDDATTLMIIHLADAPGHGANFIDAANDGHPDKATGPEGETVESLVKLAGLRAIDYTFVLVNADSHGRHAKKMIDAMEVAYNAGPPVRGKFKRAELGADTRELAKVMLKCTTSSLAMTSHRSRGGWGSGRPSGASSSGAFAKLTLSGRPPLATPSPVSTPAEAAKKLVLSFKLRALKKLQALGAVTADGSPSGVPARLSESDEDELTGHGLTSGDFLKLAEVGVLS